MSEVEAQTFVFGGSQLVYEDYGSGDRVLVYVHGLLMDSGMNRPLARSLADRGHRVVLLDVLGHGRSDKPLHASAYRMDAYGREVVACVEAGKVEFRPVPVDLVALVEEVTEVLSEIARQKGIRVAKRTV